MHGIQLRFDKSDFFVTQMSSTVMILHVDTRYYRHNRHP